MRSAKVLQNAAMPVKAKISALWASAMFCYVYGDIIGFFSPGALQRMLDGKMGFWPASAGILLGATVVMSIPAVMVALTLLLKPGLSRWLNVIVGAAETALMLYTMIDAWKFGYAFYIYVGGVAVILNLLVVWYALTWPKQAAEI